jgi:hypothetical protein
MSQRISLHRRSIVARSLHEQVENLALVDSARPAFRGSSEPQSDDADQDDQRGAGALRLERLAEHWTPTFAIACDLGEVLQQLLVGEPESVGGLFRQFDPMGLASSLRSEDGTLPRRERSVS